VVTFVLYPIGLPIAIGNRAQVFYQRLEEIPDGSTVWYGVDTGAGGLPELRAAMVAVGKYLFSRDINIVFASPGSNEGPIIYNILLEDIGVTSDKEYGVDYVYLGYIAGGETAMAALATDIRGLLSTDYYGTPLDDLPIMDGVNGATDFYMVFCFTSGSDPVNNYIRQWQTPFDVRLGMVVLSAMGPPTEPYYPNQIVAFLSSAKEGAEFELVLGEPGYGVASMDAQSAVHVMLIFFIILGNGYTIYRSRLEAT
jgi:hypothetical protein